MAVTPPPALSSLLPSHLSPSLLAGAVAAALASIAIAGLAYIFHPAVEAYRARQAMAQQGGRRYTFPVYKGKGRDGGEEEEEEEAAFPTVDDAPSLALSLVVPAYNEEERLPVMLEETIAYLEKWRGRDKCVLPGFPTYFSLSLFPFLPLSPLSGCVFVWVALIGGWGAWANGSIRHAFTH
jgi:hypothetical protein